MIKHIKAILRALWPKSPPSKKEREASRQESIKQAVAAVYRSHRD